MTSYEEFLALVRLFGDPKAVEAKIKLITDKQKALDTQVKELELGRNDLAAARKALNEEIKATAVKCDAAYKVAAKADADREKLGLRGVELEMRASKIEADTRKLADLSRVLDEHKRQLDEREERVKKVEQELATQKATVDEFAGRLKAAVA